MSTAVRTVYIELRASAEKLKADMEAAKKPISAAGDAGEKSGKQISAGMDSAASSARKLFEVASEGAVTLAAAHNVVAAAVARYGGAVVTSGSATENLANGYRALRVALSPTPFTVATVAIGILTEETIRLTYARAKLIEQQSLIAAISGTSNGSVEGIDAAARISGGNAGTIRGLGNALASRGQSSALNSLGLSADDPEVLAKIARAFDGIADPAKRAALAVQLFGADHADAALRELNLSFASGSDAVKRYGLVLDNVSRTQIFQFRQDILRLKQEVTDFADFKGAGSAITQFGEVLGAAVEAGAKRGFHALDELIARTTHLRGALAPLQTLSDADLHKGDRLPNDTRLGLQADDQFAIAQGTAARQSQALAGRQAAQREAQASADSAYRRLSEDQAKRQADPNDPSLLTGQQRFSLATQQQSKSALATSIGDQVKALQSAADAEKDADAAGKVRIDNQIQGNQLAAESSRQHAEIDIKLARETAQVQIDAMHDPQARAIAAADADVATAQQRLARLKPIFASETAERIRLINARAASEGTESARATATGEISSARADYSRQTVDLTGGVAEALQRSNATRSTVGREFDVEQAEVFARVLDEVGKQWQEATQRVREYEAEVARAQTRAIEIGQESAGQVNDLHIQGQKLRLERDYGQEAAHSGAQQVAYLEKVAQLEERQRQAKIGGLKGALTTAENSGDPKDIDRAADLRKNISALEAESDNASFESQTKILGVMLQQNQALQARMALAQTLINWQTIGFGTVEKDLVDLATRIPEEISSSLANGLFDRPKHGQSKGQEITSDLAKTGENVGKQLFTTLLTQGMEKLAAQFGASTAIAALQTQSQAANTAALTALAAAMAANTAAQAASGGASAAGGIASGAGSAAGAAGSVASSAASGLTGPLIAAAGGVIGGVISGLFTYFGDKNIVAAVNATTTAVYSLRGNVGLGTSSTTASTSSSTATTTPTSGTSIFGQATGFLSKLPGVAGILGGFGLGGGTPVRIVGIDPGVFLGSALAGQAVGGIAGLAMHLLGFADGGRPTPGHPIRVGERGEEVFWPDQAGTVIPHHQIAGLFGDGHGHDHTSVADMIAQYDNSPGSRSSPSGGGSVTHIYHVGGHTFHIHEAGDASDTADEVADRLRTLRYGMGPAASN